MFSGFKKGKRKIKFLLSGKVQNLNEERKIVIKKYTQVSQPKQAEPGHTYQKFVAKKNG